MTKNNIENKNFIYFIRFNLNQLKTWNFVNIFRDIWLNRHYSDSALIRNVVDIQWAIINKDPKSKNITFEFIKYTPRININGIRKYILYVYFVSCPFLIYVKVLIHRAKGSWGHRLWSPGLFIVSRCKSKQLFVFGNLSEKPQPSQGVFTKICTEKTCFRKFPMGTLYKSCNFVKKYEFYKSK